MENIIIFPNLFLEKKIKRSWNAYIAITDFCISKLMVMIKLQLKEIHRQSSSITWVNLHQTEALLDEIPASFFQELAWPKLEHVPRLF